MYDIPWGVHQYTPDTVDICAGLRPVTGAGACPATRGRLLVVDASTRNGTKPDISAHRLTRAGRTGQTRCDLRIAKSHNRYTNNLLPDAKHRQILSIGTF